MVVGNMLSRDQQFHYISQDLGYYTSVPSLGLCMMERGLYYFDLVFSSFSPQSGSRFMVISHLLFELSLARLICRSKPHQISEIQQDHIREHEIGNIISTRKTQEINLVQLTKFNLHLRE